MKARLAAAGLLAVVGTAGCGIPIPGDDSGRLPPSCERPELIEAVTAALWTPDDLQVRDTLGHFFDEPTCIVSLRWTATGDPQHRVIQIGAAWRENGLAVRDDDDHDVTTPAFEIAGDGYSVLIRPSSAEDYNVAAVVRLTMDQPVDVLAPILESVPPPSDDPPPSSTPQPSAPTSPSPPEPTSASSPPRPGAGTDGD